MDEWTNGRMDGWMDRWMDGWMDGSINAGMHVWMEAEFGVTSLLETISGDSVSRVWRGTELCDLALRSNVVLHSIQSLFLYLRMKGWALQDNSRAQLLSRTSKRSWG